LPRELGSTHAQFFQFFRQMLTRVNRVNRHNLSPNGNQQSLRSTGQVILRATRNKFSIDR
jgi:hypothetical protein